MLTDVWQDVRFGVRMLVKNPGFSLVVIAVLSLGIAGNAAIFSLFKGLALKPLPGVARLVDAAVLLGRTIDGRGIGVSLPDYRDIKEHDQAFADLTRVVDDLRERRTRRRRAARSSPSSSSATTSRRSASARNWAGRCCRRTMWRPASIRSR